MLYPETPLEPEEDWELLKLKRSVMLVAEDDEEELLLLVMILESACPRSSKKAFLTTLGMKQPS